MATKWNDLKHKASPEKRAQLKREALEELAAVERYVAALGGHLEMRAVFPDDTVDLDSLMNSTNEQRA